MKKYKSTKGIVLHFFCPNEMTIDKSKEWGEGNIQHFPNGCFCQIKDGEITHGVQPNEDKTAPVGWVKISDSENLFEKKEIFATQAKEKLVTLQTLDGKMTYENETLDGWVCYNEKNQHPDYNDAWFVENKRFNKLYKN